MRQDFLVECRNYDKTLRGSWKAHQLSAETQVGDEEAEAAQGSLRLWLPAGTPMNWERGTRPLRSHCLQFFWPERWYMLSAFYDGESLIHTYATIIQPAILGYERLSYVDLDLSMLVKPDLSYEVLTQAEFEQAANALGYDEETRISALMALRTLSSTIQRSLGVFSAVPHCLKSDLLQSQHSKHSYS